jgi:hypothetical protein
MLDSTELEFKLKLRLIIRYHRFFEFLIFNDKLELSQALKPQKTCDTLQYQQLAAMILYPYLHHIRAG